MHVHTFCFLISICFLHGQTTSAVKIKKNLMTQCNQNIGQQWKSDVTNLKVCVANCIGIKAAARKKLSAKERQGDCTFDPKTSKPVGKTFVPQDKKVILCNYQPTNLKGRRETLAQMANSQLCSHIVIQFIADIIEINKEANEYGLAENGYTTVINEEIAAIKNGVPLLFMLGDRLEDTCVKFSRLIENYQSRSFFIEKILVFMEEHKMSGVHLQWEYPVCWQCDCSAGPKEDKENFALFVTELRQQFEKKRYLISVSMDRFVPIIQQSFDLPVIMENADWLVLFTIEYRNAGNKVLGYTALLSDVIQTLDSVTAELTLDPAKIVIMIQPHQYTYELLSPNEVLPGSKVENPGQGGDLFKDPGWIFFEELCFVIKRDNWTVVRDVSPTQTYYAYKDDQWISYEDVRSLRLKAQLVYQRGLAGVWMRSIDRDDATGRCGCGNFPLLRAVNEALWGYSLTLKDCV